MCRRAQAHDGDLLGPDPREPAGDADMAQFVNDQRDDAAEAAEEGGTSENGRLRAAAECDEHEREDPGGNEGAAREDDRDRPLGEHEASVSRYLRRRDSKHANCIDRKASGLETSNLRARAILRG